MNPQPVYVPEPPPTKVPSRKFQMPIWGWILLAGFAALMSCVVLFTVLGYLAPTKTTSVPSNSGAPTGGVSQSLDQIIMLTQDQGLIVQDGQSVKGFAQAQNTDTVAHTFDVQANFYRVTLNQRGSDPAQFLVTAGTTTVTLAAGEKRLLVINAKNRAQERIASVDFNVIVK
jgi:hypothetical protein